MPIRNELLEEILTATMDGIPADNCTIGLVDYNDAATVITPINIPTGLVNVNVTNDTLGPLTNKAYLPLGVTDIWDSSTDLFDWSELKLGDMIDIRLDLSVTTTSPNQLVQVDLSLGVGGSQYSIPFEDNVFKSSGTQRITRYNGIYIGDTNTLNNGARFVIRSDNTATLVVNGWYVKVLIRG